MNVPLNLISKFVAVDAGNNEVKVRYGNLLDKFCSAIGDFHERPQKENHGIDDMEWEYQGEKGFGGTLAKVESNFGSEMYGVTKNHFEGKMRILLALHRNVSQQDIFISVCNPYDFLTKIEADDIKRSLIDTHEIKVNGITKVFNIKDVVVIGEGAAAYHSIPKHEELIRIIDIGSGTVNLITISKFGKVINKESLTAEFGMLTSKHGEASPRAIVRGIIGETSKRKWHRDDLVMIAGGAAEKLYPFIVEHYKRAEIIKPEIWTPKGIQVAKPIFANVIGSYNLAYKYFERMVTSHG